MRKMVIILDLLGVDAHLVAFMLILLAKRFFATTTTSYSTSYCVNTLRCPKESCWYSSNHCCVLMMYM